MRIEHTRERMIRPPTGLDKDTQLCYNGVALFRTHIHNGCEGVQHPHRSTRRAGKPRGVVASSEGRTGPFVNPKGHWYQMCTRLAWCIGKVEVRR